jgi:hypothetical protein
MKFFKRISQLTVLFILASLFVFISVAQSAWYNTNWSHRVKVTVDNTKVSATLTDFPVYVDLSDMPSTFFTHVKSDGGDIRVTQSNGTTEQAREVVTITPGSSIGELWFKASSLSSSVDTVFFIYYGNSSASDYAADATYGSENVYDSDYILVWHLLDATDSTSNDRHGTPAGTAAPTSSGKIDGAYDFDGDSDYITHAFPTGPANNDLTVSFWFSSDDVLADGGQIRFIDRWFHYGIYYQGSTDEWIMDYFIGESPNNVYQTVYSHSPSASTWYNIVATFDSTGGGLTFYLNGSSVATDPSPFSFGLGTLGTPLIAAGDSGSANYHDGQMDEVRFSDVDRGSDWISTEYNNQNAPSSFYTVGTEEISAFPQQIIIM